MRLLIAGVCFSFCLTSFAQRNANIITTLDSLNYTDQLPEDLLSTKSLVLVDVPARQTSPTLRGDWKKLGEIIQDGFRKGGIDAVAYYHINDVYSGPEVVEAFSKKFEERELSNVIFLLKENDRYRLIITKITDENSLIVPGQQAWQITGTELEKISREVYLKAASSGQERDNLLVIEVPIFGEMAKVIEGRRGEYFDVNFSSEKLAVPAFADTTEIDSAMQNYPYEYEIVDPSQTEKELRNKGYQYVLYYVHTTGHNVKEILEYQTTENETAYVSEVTKSASAPAKVKSVNINTPVYKFYIKHIYSENVFLGTKWDTAETWQEALANYVTNLRNQMVK